MQFQISTKPITKVDIKPKIVTQKYVVNKGDVFGELTVLDDGCAMYPYITTAGTKNNQYVRMCQCSCGEKTYTSQKNLISGRSKSCGHAITGNELNNSMRKLIIRYIKKSAKDRDINWELTDEETIWFLDQPCFYCAIVGGNTYRFNTVNKNEYKYNGIDRLNRLIGYTILNCVPCCGSCNKAKHTASLDEFAIKIKTIYENLNLAHYIPARENEIYA